MAHVADHLSVSALEQQYRSCTDVTAARHLQTIWLLAKGHHIAEVAATVSYAQRWVERLLARYNAQGPQALGDLRRRNGTSPSVLRPDLLEKLKERLREPPPDGGLWTSPKVAAWMAGELGLAAVLPQRGWEALKAINWSVQKPRPRHPGSATPEEGRAIPEKLEQAVAEERAQHPHTPVEVWATDEHRIGLKPIIRRVWAPKGQRPIALGHHRYKWLYVTAFVQPTLYGASDVKRFRPRWPRPDTAIAPDLAEGVLASILMSLVSIAMCTDGTAALLARSRRPNIPVAARVPSSDPARRLEDKLLGESRASTIRGELAIGRGSSRHTLVFGRSTWDRNHDAVMRIGGEAPGRRAHSQERCQHHGRLRVTATSDRHWRPTISCSPGSKSSQSLSCPRSPVTLLARRRQPAPRPWSPFATVRSAAFSRGPRSGSCACHHGRRPSAPGTTAPAHSPSDEAGSARPAGSSRAARGRCPPWRALSRAAGCHSRRVSR